MNEINPISAPVPPQLPPPHDTMALGATPQEREPINGLVAVIEALLRQPRRLLFQLRQQSSNALIGKLVVLAVLCSAIYGVVVGTFSLGDQLWAAPVKICLGMLLAGLICLPSLYIFSALGGSQARLVEVLGLMAGLLALSTILLIGFAPVAWVFSQSTKSVTTMGLLHLIFCLIAAGFGLSFLFRGFRHLGSHSTSALLIWSIIFLLVCLQMTTTLRPIIGKGPEFLPGLKEKQFFLEHWGNCMKTDWDQPERDGSKR
jgi:hypothetical protein